MNEVTAKIRSERAAALRTLADQLDRDEIGAVAMTAVARDGSLHKMLIVVGATPLDVYGMSGVLGCLQFEAGELATQFLRASTEAAKKVTVTPPQGGQLQ